jgi:hypothetical protein
MSVDLISLAYAKAHVRLDHDVEDVDLGRKISAASVMLVAYLKDGALEFLDSSGVPLALDSSGEPVVPADVQSACAVLVGMLFKDRDGTMRESWPQGYLPFEVTAQVYMRRDPALS